ncbi:MAG: DUF1553 domain-containing protein [Gemmataceae bacterium]|nr:DUF1553 domain-containing protein [Gemmataceae bacterium]MDW8265864.1 DUF1553 domain-containing protein [Gemmataceae bacterium]
MNTRLCLWTCGALAACWVGTASAEAPAPTTEVLPAQVRWAKDGPGGTPGFRRHIEPLMSKVGCAGRACHGSFQGAGGFRLSLFGSDPKADFNALTQDGKIPRVDVNDPGNSLALLKATKTVAHKGGQRFEVGSWQYRMFHDWIAAGAPYKPESEPLLEGLEITPAAVVLPRKGETVQLKVVALYADKTREDVTALTQFSTNDEAIATVTDAGLITAVAHGDTAVVATFGGAVGTSHVLIPLTGSTNSVAFQPNNTIDELCAAKWRKLGLKPSDTCTDSEFLRRAHLDLIGTLPTSDEVRRFLADQDPNKRAKKIDELLERPEYAMFWATKFSDLTGNDDRFTPLPRPKTAWLWYDWLKDKLEKNVPYDELVAGIITATTREGRSVEETIEEHKKVADGIAGENFDTSAYARRKTNDIFWKKAGNRGDQVALQISYAFLGIRLECAQCHKHPFDRWTQDDFKGYVQFFSAVRSGIPNDVPKELVPQSSDRQTYQYSEIYVQLPEGEKGGKKKAEGPANTLKPRALGGAEYPIRPGQDPRVALMEWMRSPDNPFFAKAIVNRIWAHYFGVGIVDPPDDLNAGNPPSNPELLDWLARDFIDHKFDLKHLHRTILNSRVYQLSWKTNETNALDRRNFSHALLRRLPAEVVVDAINQVTGGREFYNRNIAPPGTRAIGLAPTRLGTNNGTGYALSIFGRPLRTQTCDCERSSDAGLPQAMYLINDVDVNNKIAAANGELSKLLRRVKKDPELVEELYLRTVSRFPTAEETRKALEYVARAADRKAGFEDVLWSLINLREFVFNH